MDHNAQSSTEKRAGSIDAPRRGDLVQLVREFRQRAEERREKATSLFSLERSRHVAAATAYENAADLLEDQLGSS